MVKKVQLGALEKLYSGLLLVIFGGVVFHAPLSVWLSTAFPQHDLLIKSWKELLMGVALVLAVYIVTKRRLWSVFKAPLFLAIGAFAALNVVLVPLYFTGVEPTLAALLINLRYFLFFVLVYVAVVTFPFIRRWFVGVFFGGAALAVLFAVLQATVLPYDILKYIGYSPNSIVPYLTVDQNMDYIRITGTFRGPNPLGAYMVMVLAMAAAFLAYKVAAKRWVKWGIGALGVGAFIALWATYARAAALGAIVALSIVALVVYGKRISRAVWVALGITGLALVGTVVVLYETPFVSQVILHEDPNEGNAVNSNDGHAESLADGATRMLRQPLGGGVGSTGSPSLLGDEPLIIENQYFYVAHEVGWVGLGLFLYISCCVLAQAWRRRADWLSLAVFASGVGLMLIGIVLPVWADDAVSIIWWGLAAVALASRLRVVNKTTV